MGWAAAPPAAGEARSLLGAATVNNFDACDVSHRVDGDAAINPGYVSLSIGNGSHYASKPDPRSARQKRFFGAFISSIALLLAATHLRSSAIAHQQQPMMQLTSQTADGDNAHSDTSEHQRLFEGAYSTATNEPLSHKSPSELGVPIFNDRPASSRPGSVFGPAQNGTRIGVPLPTNEWWLSLVVGLDESPGPDGRYENYAGEENRAHTIPYIVDTVGSIVGIRLHYPHVLSYGTVVQSSLVAPHGLALGTADEGFTRRYQVDEKTLPSKLGVGLRWESRRGDESYMRSSILRGMPYGTMVYSPGVEPTIASEIVAELPLVDGRTRLKCGTLDPASDRILENASSVLVEEVELYFSQSDFTWLVFFSQPVHVRCFINPDKVTGTVSLPPGAAAPDANPNAFQLRVDSSSGSSVHEDEPLIVRMALANNCTHGSNVNFCKEYQPRDQSSFKSVLRDHAAVYPTSPVVRYAFSDPEGGLTPDAPESKDAYLFFDWRAKSFRETEKELIMYALPHHVDTLRPMHEHQSSNELLGHCVHSLHGNSCIVKGGLWAMDENLDALPSFMAPRPPSHFAIPALADALSTDIDYSLPDNYMEGAGDTYFSAKMLAKLGRIIVIAQELRGLAEIPDDDERDISSGDDKELLAIVRACKEVDLPTEDQVMNAIGRLRRGVEVWLDGGAPAQFTFDNSWGGMVSCGCLYNWDNGCDNAYPNCPSYSDPGLNFGQGFYNDHHFHFGYIIYAASIVAQYDRAWGRRYFEQVTLLIRDIANPSAKDKFFPVFRQKDWFLGNSWASGIALFGGRPHLNGRNQESSSEAIAAYEGIAMYGSVLMKAFGNGNSTNTADNENAHRALHIFNVGRFLAATEIRSADRYWHVYSPKRDAIYPDSYTPHVVSMMWDTMCQFQTWFGNAPYLAYGIQLLPLTPISERRDTDQWLRVLYPSFAESCDSNPACNDEGWSVLLYAVLASLGHSELAMEKALLLPEDVFTSAGGSGHSRTNTLWYISTRPELETPYDLEQPSSSIHSKTVPESEQEKKIDCGCPDTCTSEALASDADGFTCKQRVQWLMTNRGLSELGACRQVGGNEYQSQCGSCDPEICAEPDTNKEIETVPVPSGCPPCKADVCESDINRCQLVTAPFLCFEGPATGGCAAIPWPTDDNICASCCELFHGC